MAENSEGSEREGLSEARDARGKITLAQGKLSDCSGGRLSYELCVMLENVMGRRFCSASSVKRRGRRQVEKTVSKCGRVVEDAKVLWRGRGVSGVSGGEMGSKCCRSVE